MARPSCCVNAAPPDDGDGLERRSLTGTARLRRAKAYLRHARMARRCVPRHLARGQYAVAALRAACRSETGAPSPRTIRSRGAPPRSSIFIPDGVRRTTRMGVSPGGDPADKAREGGIPGVFRPKRNAEGHFAARFRRDASPFECRVTFCTGCQAPMALRTTSHRPARSRYAFARQRRAVPTCRSAFPALLSSRRQEAKAPLRKWRNW